MPFPKVAALRSTHVACQRCTPPTAVAHAHTAPALYRSVKYYGCSAAATGRESNVGFIYSVRVQPNIWLVGRELLLACTCKPVPCVALQAPCRQPRWSAPASLRPAPSEWMNHTACPLQSTCRNRRYYFLAAHSRGVGAPSASVILRFRPDEALPPAGSWAYPDKVPATLPFASSPINVSAAVCAVRGPAARRACACRAPGKRAGRMPCQWPPRFAGHPCMYTTHGCSVCCLCRNCATTRCPTLARTLPSASQRASSGAASGTLAALCHTTAQYGAWLACSLAAATHSAAACRWLSSGAASGRILASACGINGVALSIRSTPAPTNGPWQCVASGAAGCPNGAPGASLTFDVRKTTYYYFIVSGDAAVGATLNVQLAPLPSAGSWTNPEPVTTLTTTVPFVSPPFNVSGSGGPGGGLGMGGSRACAARWEGQAAF